MSTHSTVRCACTPCPDDEFLRRPTATGTGIHVAASIASPDASYSVKIDDGAFEPQTSNGTYDSPVLSDGKHTLTYATASQKALPSFDYLTVTAGPSTPLRGQTLAVDDSDTSIVYSGNWSTTPPSSVVVDASSPLYGNTAHWSSNIGNSLEFQFTGRLLLQRNDIILQLIEIKIGSSISVYGILANLSTNENITAAYIIDGISKVQSIPQGTLNSLPMVELFHADVQPGDHTLFVNITEIQITQAIGIDFVAYNASFDTIAPASTASSTSSALGSSRSLRVGAKVGISVGVLAAIMLATLCMVLWRRRSLRNPKNPKFRLPDDCKWFLSKFYIYASDYLFLPQLNTMSANHPSLPLPGNPMQPLALSICSALVFTRSFNVLCMYFCTLFPVAIFCGSYVTRLVLEHSLVFLGF